MKLGHRQRFLKWNFANVLPFTFNMVVRKAQLSGNLSEPAPQFPTPPHEQDEDAHAVFLPVQVSYFSFSLPQVSASC